MIHRFIRILNISNRNINLVKFMGVVVSKPKIATICAKRIKSGETLRVNFIPVAIAKSLL